MTQVNKIRGAIASIKLGGDSPMEREKGEHSTLAILTFSTLCDFECLPTKQQACSKEKESILLDFMSHHMISLAGSLFQTIQRQDISDPKQINFAENSEN